MPDRAFRFIHASDFWLDVPAMGLAEIPDRLVDVLIDAPYHSAQRVFEAACTEQVDMLILSGNILDPARCDLRAHLFLVEQFRHLASQGIAVYWAGGRFDTPENWPATFDLPENVTFFPHDRVESVVHRADESTHLAVIQGMSRGTSRRSFPVEQFGGDPDGLYTIAVAEYDENPERLKHRGVDFFALGGVSNRRTLPGHSPTMNWAGTTLGRGPADQGLYGYSLVDVEGERARVTFRQAATVKWHTERIVVEKGMARDDLVLQLMERAETLRQSTAASHLIVSWLLEGNTPLLMQLARGGRSGSDAARLLLEELQDSVNQDHAGLKGSNGTTEVWNVALHVQPTDLLSHIFYQKKNILNDYLQTISNYQMNPGEPIDLQSYMSERLQSGKLSRLARFENDLARDNVLREAAMLGVDLLGHGADDVE